VKIIENNSYANFLFLISVPYFWHNETIIYISATFAVGLYVV